MSQQVQELINKIKKEGTEAAESEASTIKERAQADADKIISEANARAEQIVNDANAQAEKAKESGQMALKQASRDVLLSLRKEIDALLQKIIAEEVKESLSAENLANIIGNVAEASQKSDNVVATLSAKDRKALEDGFIAKLQKKIKGSITFESSGDVAGGFTISFDGGKSCFEYTDKALAEYLSSHLNEQLTQILKEAGA